MFICFQKYFRKLKLYCCDEIFYNISKSIKYLFVFKNISESWNCTVVMKYFAIFHKNIATIFQLQWDIGNISDIFLQYSVLCGRCSIPIGFLKRSILMVQGSVFLNRLFAIRFSWESIRSGIENGPLKDHPFWIFLFFFGPTFHNSASRE